MVAGKVIPGLFDVESDEKGNVYLIYVEQASKSRTEMKYLQGKRFDIMPPN